jgi:tRNA(fMet)-specific endonuclease VapC
LNIHTPGLFLPDTNILVHHARRSRLYQWIEAHCPIAATDPPLLLSVVTVGEIVSLTTQFKWGAAKRQIVDDFIARCVVVPLDAPGLIDAYAFLDNYSLDVGRSMGDNDLWIAATVQVSNATLLTTDKDFDHLAPKHIQRDWIDPNTR